MLVGAFGMVLSILSIPARATPAVECPLIGAGRVAAALPDCKDGNFPLEADDTTTAEKIDALIQRVRKDQPGISFRSLINSLTAAYCPIAVRQPDRTDAQKRAQLARFDKILEKQIARSNLARGNHILAEVPLSATTMRAVATAAARACETPGQWMAEVVGKAAEER